MDVPFLAKHAVVNREMHVTKKIVFLERVAMVVELQGIDITPKIKSTTKMVVEFVIIMENIMVFKIVGHAQKKVICIPIKI